METIELKTIEKTDGEVKEVYQVDEQGRKQGKYLLTDAKTGRKIEEVNYKNGLVHGVYIEYNYLGRERLIMMCENGEAHGRYETYHINGVICHEGVYAKGKKQGLWTVRDEEGNAIFKGLYDKGVCVEILKK